MTVPSSLSLPVVDHDGTKVPCNGEQSFSEYQKSVACWLALDLLFAGKADETFVAAFFRFLLANSGRQGDTAEVARSFKHEYDRMLGQAAAWQDRDIFHTQADRLTLYKICRWAARLGQDGHAHRKALLENLRHELKLYRDHRSLLISTAIERRTSQFELTSRSSLTPAAALAVQILNEDRNFSDIEKKTLHRVMLNIGVQPGEVNDIRPLCAMTPTALVGMMDRADYENVLTIILKMAILDDRITTAERRILDEIVEAMQLNQDQLDRIRTVAELDTGATIRFADAITIDYSQRGQ
jgi:hypothetical protein